jgi:hypothetical protein
MTTMMLYARKLDLPYDGCVLVIAAGMSEEMKRVIGMLEEGSVGEV